MEGGFGSDFGGSGSGKLDPGLIMEQVKVQIAVANAQELLQVGQVLPEVHREAGGLPGQFRAEVHRHVHGPLHGRLEHRVPRLQLAAAAGTSQHVTGPPAAPLPGHVHRCPWRNGPACVDFTRTRPVLGHWGLRLLRRPPAPASACSSRPGGAGHFPERWHPSCCAQVYLESWTQNPGWDLGGRGQTPTEL
nr:PREDICTED: mitochondrial import inner membrane translocase subunit Tim13 isoform X1 [Equus przewalskii]